MNVSMWIISDNYSRTISRRIRKLHTLYSAALKESRRSAHYSATLLMLINWSHSLRDQAKRKTGCQCSQHATRAPIKYLNAVSHKQYYVTFFPTLLRDCVVFFEKDRLVIAVQAPAYSRFS